MTSLNEVEINEQNFLLHTLHGVRYTSDAQCV
jgi:hypothetical protein